MAPTRRKNLLTTGQVAKLCSVTPDTVLKWIRAGKLPATRTAGGHHRIPRDAVQQLVEVNHRNTDIATGDSRFIYCWEFNSESGRLPAECRQCIVYRSRTRRCYEISDLPVEAGHARRFCTISCEECDYFKLVKGQRPNVLVVTDHSELQDELSEEAARLDFNLEFTDCEYRCSMAIEEFRPDYVVIDCSLGTLRAQDFARMLYEDPRIPFVKVVLVANGERLPKECDKTVFALLDRRFTAGVLSDLIGGGENETATGTEEN